MFFTELPPEMQFAVFARANMPFPIRAVSRKWRDIMNTFRPDYDYLLWKKQVRADKRPEPAKVRDIMANLRTLAAAFTITSLTLGDICVHTSDRITGVLSSKLTQIIMIRVFFPISLFHGLPECTGLHTLALYNCFLSDTEMMALGQWIPPGLQRLTLHTVGIREGRGMQGLALMLTRITSLVRLDISGNPARSYSELIVGLRNQKNLDRFSCSSLDSDFDSICFLQLLEGLENSTELTYLLVKMHSRVLTEAQEGPHLQAVRQSVARLQSLSKLKYLYISGWAAVQNLLDLNMQSFPDLTCLELSACDIDNDVLKALCTSLKHHAHFKFVNFENNWIDAEGLPAIRDLAASCATLENVRLDENEAPAEDLHQLRRALKRINVEVSYAAMWDCDSDASSAAADPWSEAEAESDSD
jgi:hypothetical protein